MLRRSPSFALLCSLVACGFQVAQDTAGPGATPDGGGGGDGGDGPRPDAPCVDTDGDTICDAVDVCPGSDDRADEDLDGIPDGCDAWPCGAAPASPPGLVAWSTPSENVTLSAISIAGQGQRVVASPGQSLSLAAAYSIVDCQCTNCIDQIEVGFEPGGKQACLYNGNPQGSSPSPGCAIPTPGTATRMLTAPMQPGVHQVRFNRGNDASCQNNGVWWANVAPPAGNTIALVCVR